MNRESIPSSGGGELNRFDSGSVVLSPRSPGSVPEDTFQKLLSRIAARVDESSTRASLIQFFCHAAREYFEVAGVYVWNVESSELVGEQSDGKGSEEFVGLRLPLRQGGTIAESVRRRKTLFTNQTRTSAFPADQAFGARAVMAAPLIVFNELVGAATFLHDEDENFFNEDLAAKATVLTGQLGSLLESMRLVEVSREEHRHAQILADVSQALHPNPDVSSVIEALADRIRLLLRTRLVCVLLRREGPFELRAVAAESSQVAGSVRSRHDRQMIRFAADLAQRAVSAGEPLTISIGGEAHSLGSIVSPGMLIAAPFRTSRTQGAILVYPRQEGIFTTDEKALVAAIAGSGAVAVAHAELYTAAHAQAHELQQLLEISSALSSSGDWEQFLQTFVLRASDFLGFGQCFIALLEDGIFRVRYSVEKGEVHRRYEIFPEGLATKALRAGEVFWTDKAEKLPTENLEVIAKHEIQQLLAVPLLGARGELLGMFGSFVRLDGSGMSDEDIRRARALSNQLAVVLETARNLHLSEQHQRHVEALMEVARGMDGTLRLPEVGERLVSRCLELFGAQAGALALFQDGQFRSIALLSKAEGKPSSSEALAGPSLIGEHRDGQSIEQILELGLSHFGAHSSESIVCGSAAQLLGSDAAHALAWQDCILVRLQTFNHNLFGFLCLSGRTAVLAPEERTFLEALARAAAVALANASLFTKVEQANRHWTQIFDAITDFIVAHDANDKILRVNLSLANMIGVPPSELIGVSMRSLLTLAGTTTTYSCPFCRSNDNSNDEFVHPVLDRTYLVSTSRVRAGSSETQQTIHVLKDITDRREAERRYRELFDNIQEGLFFSTPDGRFVEVNDAMVQMLGYSSREELLQVDIAHELYQSAEEMQRPLQMMREHGHLRNFEATLRRKNGAPIHVLINAFGLYDDQGQLLQIRGLMLDVTGLRTYQSELHRERDFSGKILNNTQSLIVVADTAGLISYVNRRWSAAGFHQSDLLGRPLLELAAPGFVRALADAVQSTLQGQQIDNLELQVVRGHGMPGKFSANLSPMRDEQGNVTSIVVVLTDITDSSVLRDKLLHAEKMAAVGQLVSGVAHEVNNPLTAILGFADLLMETPELPEAARRDLRVILQEAQRTKQIVQNLLSFARQMPPQRNAVQINSILRRTVQLRAYDFNSHGIDVVEHLDENLPEVFGDAHQLQQVFLNILNNAYDAVHEVGRPARIEIMTTKAGEVVEISFRDNGQGISQPDRIFDPFFTTKEIGKGTGLGLSICYGIVKEHGGEILCHNNTDGQGATFIVRLPAASHTASVGVAAGVIQR